MTPKCRRVHIRSVPVEPAKIEKRLEDVPPGYGRLTIALGTAPIGRCGS
jgi:hypothetical protein